VVSPGVLGGFLLGSRYAEQGEVRIPWRTRDDPCGDSRMKAAIKPDYHLGKSSGDLWEPRANPYGLRSLGTLPCPQVGEIGAAEWVVFEKLKASVEPEAVSSLARQR